MVVQHIPPHTQLASYSHHEGISKLTTTTSLYSKSQWTRSSRNISGHIEYALAAQAYLGLHSNVIRMRWARLRVLILSVCIIPQFFFKSLLPCKQKKHVKSHRPVKNDIPEIHDFKLEGVTIK